MHNFIIIIALAILVLGGGYAVQKWTKPSPPTTLQPTIGQVVQNFDFETLDGADFALYDFKNKPMIVHFWATWCPPCVVEFPELLTFANNNPDIVVLAISVDKKDSQLHRFFKKNKLEIPENVLIVKDRDQKIMHEQFGTFQLPETYILSPNMVFQEKISGAYKDWNTFQFLP